MNALTIKELLSRGPRSCEHCGVEFIGDSSKKVCGPCNATLMKEGVLHLKDGRRRRLVTRRVEHKV